MVRLLIGLLCCLLADLALSEPSVEDKVKAAIVVKLAKFVDWPPGSMAEGAPLPLCLVGDSELTQVLRDIGLQTARGHELRVERLSTTDPAQLAGCRMLFVGLGIAGRLPGFLKTIEDIPMLTISDIPGFTRVGGMVGLVKAGNHLAFEINLKAVKASKLAISAQLLELATVIE